MKCDRIWRVVRSHCIMIGWRPTPRPGPPSKLRKYSVSQGRHRDAVFGMILSDDGESATMVVREGSESFYPSADVNSPDEAIQWIDGLAEKLSGGRNKSL